MVDLFKRMFRKDAASAAQPLATPSLAGQSAAVDRSELQLAARRAQIANDLMELQQIAMAELALRKQQDEAGSAGEPVGRSDFDGDTPFGHRVAIV